MVQIDKNYIIASITNAAVTQTLQIQGTYFWFDDVCINDLKALIIASIEITRYIGDQ